MVSLMFLLCSEMRSSYRNNGGAATCRWWRWSRWQPFCAYTAQIHWFLCPAINRASLGTQTVEKSSWQAEARRVLGLHFVIMVIWELKLRPLLAIEGWWYLVSAPRNLCMCHRLHFRLISDWTWTVCEWKKKKKRCLDKIFMITRNKFSHVFPNIWLVV